MAWTKSDVVKGTHLATRGAMALLLLSLGSVAAFAQVMPYHADSTARELARDNTVPAIRFLTTADFPPFNFRDASGELIGFNVDLAKRICAEVDVACTIQAWPWDQAADALADNQGDALIAGLSLTPENGERFDYSSVYLELPGRFVTRTEDLPDFDVSGASVHTVGVRAGSAHEAFLARYIPGAEIVGHDSEIEALEALQAGDVDVFFGDAMRASFWLNDNLDCCGFAGEPYFLPKLFGEGLAIALPAGQDNMRHVIDWALVRLTESGALDELYLRWFPVGFY